MLRRRSKRSYGGRRDRAFRGRLGVEGVRLSWREDPLLAVRFAGERDRVWVDRGRGGESDFQAGSGLFN